jgi:N-acetylglucosamine transport system permease protein
MSPSPPTVQTAALPVTALRNASRPAAPGGALLLIGGIAAAGQLALPWFSAHGSSSTGWDLYYHTTPVGFRGVISAYAIVIAAVAGLLMVLAGLAVLTMPRRRALAGRVGLITGIVGLACPVWWLLAGPVYLSDAFGNGTIGWYLFLLGGLVGLVGAIMAGVRATRASGATDRSALTFDKVSFMVVFLVVPLAIFIIFVVSPFVQAIYYSMTDWDGFSSTMNFTGLDNYRKLLSDDTFLQALRNNVLLAIVVPLVTIILALAIASVVTVGGPSQGPVSGIKGSSFYRVVSFFPYCIPAIVIGLIWAQVYDPSAGILNAFLTGIGLNHFQNFAWLGEVATAMPASMFVIVWGFVGFYAVLFVAAIKGIPAETYEAARLDGAGRFRTSISVTIPLIRDTVQTAYIYLGIAALDAFVYMQALNPFGGPNNSTLTMSQDLYNTAFRKGQFGYATAMGVSLAIVTLLFAVLIFVINRLTGGGKPGDAR